MSMMKPAWKAARAARNLRRLLKTCIFDALLDNPDVQRILSIRQSLAGGLLSIGNEQSRRNHESRDLPGPSVSMTTIVSGDLPVPSVSMTTIVSPLRSSIGTKFRNSVKQVQMLDHHFKMLTTNV